LKIENTLYVVDREAWRRWLAEHHQSETEIWLVFYRKGTGKPNISYNDAVEEALAYGWIDSIRKSLDQERYAQRFSQRKPNSKLSQMNRERIRVLIAQGKMTRAGMDAIAHVFDPTVDADSEFEIPAAILEALKANPEAWTNFQAFPASYRRIRVAYVESQRRHGEAVFRKALNHLIDMSAKNKRFGYVKEMR
jgi:uncharacterized protein YdeI (YjbR/CyaY-like superfamily)